MEAKNLEKSRESTKNGRFDPPVFLAGLLLEALPALCVPRQSTY